jgi:hypothetical protein
MSFEHVFIALIAGLPGIITAISSFRNGSKLRSQEKKIDELNGHALAVRELTRRVDSKLKNPNW